MKKIWFDHFHYFHKGWNFQNYENWLKIYLFLMTSFSVKMTSDHEILRWHPRFAVGPSYSIPRPLHLWRHYIPKGKKLCTTSQAHYIPNGTTSKKPLRPINHYIPQCYYIPCTTSSHNATTSHVSLHPTMLLHPMFHFIP